MALISNKATLNEEIDPYLTIARLQREITRLKTELAIARGETGNSDEELPDYELERYTTTCIKYRIKQYVDDFLSNSSNELCFSDFRKISAAFNILRVFIALRP